MLKRITIIGLTLVILVAGALFVLYKTVYQSSTIVMDTPVAPTLPPETPQVAETAVLDLSQITPSAASSATPLSPEAQFTSITPSTNSTSIDLLRFRIDASQSEAHYEVNETFLKDNRFATAIGRTKGIAGEFLVDPSNPAKSQVGDIVVDISQLTSDQPRRDNFIRNNNLQSVQYPQATFKTHSIEGMPASIKVGDTVNFKMIGDLTVKQTSQPVTWEVTVKVGSDRLTGTATTQVLMSQFGIGPIQLMMLNTEDLVKLYFDFVALQVK